MPQFMYVFGGFILLVGIVGALEQGSSVAFLLGLTGSGTVWCLGKIVEILNKRK